MASNLRLVTWNVCDDVARKIVHLERLTPGIAVLQEVRPSGLSSVGLDKSSLWVGEAGQKGLAIIAYGGWALTPVAPVDERWFVAVRARRGEDSIHIVGVWADSSRDCGPLTLRAIDTLKDVLTSAPCIMAGDFNQSVRLDAGKGQGRRFSTVVKTLAELGLSSAWHAHTAEAHGGEAAATYFHLRNPHRPFHIDFSFSNMTPTYAAIGSADTYLGASDHMPLIVDYAWTRGVDHRG